MSVELSVVGGFGVLSFMFAFFAFKLRDSEVESNKIIGVFLAFISLIFMNILVYTMLLMAQNSLTYLEGIVTNTLLVIMWVSNILIFYMLAAGVYGLITSLFAWFKTFTRRRQD